MTEFHVKIVETKMFSEIFCMPQLIYKIYDHHFSWVSESISMHLFDYRQKKNLRTIEFLWFDRKGKKMRYITFR
jgi:hypothetical protein